MGIVYSEPELAIDSGLDYFYKEEENIYICPVFHPSGVEYVLKKRKDIVSEECCIKKYTLTENHRFRVLDHAINAISYFRKAGRRLQAKKHFEEENGYKRIKYYYLCST